ncbi:MAG: hypothetical protein IKZ13_05925 [Akkermansia sp.]|nr:hypothetical protein [Akkermansia sp.]
MKFIIIAMIAVSGACLCSCQRSVPMVPQTNRVVVPPSGSTDSPKSWSRVTEQEGNAVLGPLSNMRR